MVPVNIAVVSRPQKTTKARIDARVGGHPNLERLTRFMHFEVDFTVWESISIRVWHRVLAGVSDAVG